MISEILLFLNIGTSEMMLILLVALFFFGGKKLPELARGLGRGIREFKDASETIKQDISDQINNFEKDLEVKDKPKAITQHSADSSDTPTDDSAAQGTEDISSSDQYYQNHNYDYNYPEETFGSGATNTAEHSEYVPAPDENPADTADEIPADSDDSEHPTRPDHPENA